MSLLDLVSIGGLDDDYLLGYITHVEFVIKKYKHRHLYEQVRNARRILSDEELIEYCYARMETQRLIGDGIINIKDGKITSRLFL